MVLSGLEETTSMERGSEFHPQTHTHTGRIIRIMRLMREEYRESEQRRPIVRGIGGRIKRGRQWRGPRGGRQERAPMCKQMAGL